MNIIEIIISSISLGMDAFAVAICKGLSVGKFRFSVGIIVGLYFGLFQGIMPFIGYVIGSYFEEFIVNIDHWIVFGLLFIIGCNMISESKEDSECNSDISLSLMLPLAIATSIDALAMGITFAFLKVNIFISVLCIGIITFIMSFLGVYLGGKVGNKYEKKAKVLGGIILIILSVKILLEHIGII